MICGSREFAEELTREGTHRPSFEREADVLFKAVTRLVGRWVIGNIEGKRDRKAAEGPGLVVITGGARGADRHAENVVRIMAAGLRRRSRQEYDELETNFDVLTGDHTELAYGLWSIVDYAAWDLEGPGAGHIRNQKMVDRDPDEVIALYAAERFCQPNSRGGTNDMVRRSLARGIPVHAYLSAHDRWETLR